MRPDEVLRFAFSQGSGKSIVTEPISVQTAATTSGRLPAAARLTSTTALPFGTVDLLADTPYPRRAGFSGADRRVRLGHALVAAFGLQRREPSNPYNDHRGIPSVRSKFPVHAFLTDRWRSQVLDVYRHALIDLDTASTLDAPAAIALAGRYTHLPSFYQRLRGAPTTHAP